MTRKLIALAAIGAGYLLFGPTSIPVMLLIYLLASRRWVISIALIMLLLVASQMTMK